MARVEFTDRWLKALKPNAARRLEWWDAKEPGLVVRVTPAGVAGFAVRYRFNGEPRRLTVGRVGPLALADARRNALKILAKVSDGLDPVAMKKEERPEAARRALRGDTFEALARQCLDAIAPQLKPRSLVEYRRALEHDAFPRLGKLRPATITRGDVRALIQEVAKRAPVQGNRTYAAIRRVVGWALEQDLLPASPCAGLKRPSEETHRERNFNNAEIRAIFEAIPDTELEHLVAFIFYTATRSHEARGAWWDEFDLERRLWTIPAERRKMRKRKASPAAHASFQRRASSAGAHATDRRLRILGPHRHRLHGRSQQGSAVASGARRHGRASPEREGCQGPVARREARRLETAASPQGVPVGFHPVPDPAHGPVPDDGAWRGTGYWRAVSRARYRRPPRHLRSG
jgi:site-specific recombinase XerC